MRSISLPLVLAAALALPVVARAAGPQRPNIVVFLVDDMGWQDTSVPFAAERSRLNDKFHTPNMQKLADAGVKFTRAYACSVCSPTRVSLMTGMNAARHRVTNWTLRKNVANDHPHPALAFPQWNVNGLSPVPGVERTVYATPLPLLLRQAGYRTIHVGKAHFGAIGTPGEDPCNLGFEVNIGGHAAGGPGSYLGTQNFSAAFCNGPRHWDVPGLDAYHGKDIFLTEALTIEANKAIDSAVARSEPFYLYMSHYAVHVPYAADNRFYQKYLDAGLDKTEAMYAALVEGMDKSLGDIMANIERHGQTDNTIILFMSDNGGVTANSRGGAPHIHNAPLSSGKGSAREGGTRVPMIVRWPGVTTPGSVCDKPVIIEDYFPTILELAGVTQPRIVQKIDGVSFVPLLRGSGDPSVGRSLFWHFPNELGISGPGVGASSTILNGGWKLIYYHASRRVELFNVAADLSEKHNLAAADAARVSALSAELAGYLRSVEAQMPTVRATGQPVPYPGE